jgi:hypothetical protein
MLERPTVVASPLIALMADNGAVGVSRFPYRAASGGERNFDLPHSFEERGFVC